MSFGEIGLAVKDKKIVIPKPFADKLGEFARWVAGKYGTKPGVNQVYGVTGDYVTLADGTKFYLCTMFLSAYLKSRYYRSQQPDRPALGQGILIDRLSGEEI